jgi:hypothetical protein
VPDPTTFERPTHTDPRAAEAPAELFGEMPQRVAEVRAYAAHYAAVRVDQARLAARKALMLAVVGLIGAIAAITMTITAVIYLLAGGARGIAALAGGHLWVGYLVVGVLVLGLLGGALTFGMARLKQAGQRNAARRYDKRKREQRERFGHDVEQVARAARRPVTPAGGG